MSVKSTFRSLETDEEFRTRLRVAGYDATLAMMGAVLDELAWNEKKMQRRLIDRTA